MTQTMMFPTVPGGRDYEDPQMGPQEPVTGGELVTGGSQLGNEGHPCFQRTLASRITFEFVRAGWGPLMGHPDS